MTLKPKVSRRPRFCPQCQAGPLKGRHGIEVHAGKPDNIATHLSLVSPATRRKHAKNGLRINFHDTEPFEAFEEARAMLRKKWLEQAIAEGSNSDVVRTYLQCVNDLVAIKQL